MTHVIQHEDWNETIWDNDIAILVLNESLVFDNFTRPIDIWKTGARWRSKNPFDNNSLPMFHIYFLAVSRSKLFDEQKELL